jgi:DNA-binding SARP family transcriptional activator
VKFNVLGRLEITADSGQPVAIPRARIRSLLVGLLLNSNRPVASADLLEAIWDDEVHARRGTLRSHIHLLRRNLHPADRVSREQDGYLIRVLPGELDLANFRGLVARGREALERHELSRAERLLAQGVSLWCAPRIPDLPAVPGLLAEAARVTAEYLVCQELLADTMLAQQRNHEVLPQLFAQVHAFPDNERTWEQLMIALYRTGRRTEAIRAFGDVRHLLAERYGLEPGPSLRRVFDLMLGDDPALMTPAYAGRTAARCAPDAQPGSPSWKAGA